MQSIDNVPHRTVAEYTQAAETMKAFSTMAVLWAKTANEGDLRTEIIGNFIARGTILLDSIRLLWETGSYNDCWILHRALIDRVIHILDLIDQDAFEEFERWSFQRMYRMTDVALGDQTIVAKFTPAALKQAKDMHANRGRRYRNEPPSNWKRPQAKEVAKRKNLPVLDRIGYEPASAAVHPMAEDGKAEFAAITGIPTEPIGDNRTVLRNSLVVQFLLVERGIGGCNLLWRSFVNDFLEHWFSFLETGKAKSMQSCLRVLTLAANDPELSWCEKHPV